MEVNHELSADIDLIPPEVRGLLNQLR